MEMEMLLEILRGQKTLRRRKDKKYGVVEKQKYIRN